MHFDHIDTQTFFFLNFSIHLRKSDTIEVATYESMKMFWYLQHASNVSIRIMEKLTKEKKMWLVFDIDHWIVYQFLI